MSHDTQRQRLQTFLLWFNGVQVIAWGGLIVPTLLIWSRSLLWIALMSVWANFAGAIAGLTAALLAGQIEDTNGDSK